MYYPKTIYGYTTNTATSSGTHTGYQSGGYTGNGGVSDVAGVVHGQEYVVNASTTNQLGLNGSGGLFQVMANELISLRQLMYEEVKTSKRSFLIQKDTNNILSEAS